LQILDSHRLLNYAQGLLGPTFQLLLDLGAMGKKGAAEQLRSEVKGSNPPKHLVALSDLLTVLLAAMEENRRHNDKLTLSEGQPIAGGRSGSGSGGGSSGDAGGSGEGGEGASVLVPARAPERSPNPCGAEIADTLVLPLKRSARLVQPVRRGRSPSPRYFSPRASNSIIQVPPVWGEGQFRLASALSPSSSVGSLASHGDGGDWAGSHAEITLQTPLPALAVGNGDEARITGRS
jgi:hypothetical protein